MHLTERCIYGLAAHDWEVPYFEDNTGLDLEQMDYTVGTGMNC